MKNFIYILVLAAFCSAFSTPDRPPRHTIHVSRADINWVNSLNTRLSNLFVTPFSSIPYKDSIFAGMVVRCWVPFNATGEAIFGMPGLGELGNGTLANDTACHSGDCYIQSWLMGYWLTNGWDGSVPLGNGIHHPSFFQIIQNSNISSAGNTQPPNIKAVIDAIMASRFRPSKGFGNLSWVGFSAGGNVGLHMAEYRPTVNDTTYYKYISSGIADLQGVIPDDQFGATLPYPTGFGQRMAASPLAYIGVEGTFDESRDIWGRRNNMNDSLPPGADSAHGLWTDTAGGVHGFWNTHMNPFQTNFTATNPNYLLAHDGATSNYIKPGQNLWQFLLRGNGHSDTTLGGAPTVVAGNYFVDQSNGYDLILNPTVTGSNLKYKWVWSGYYTANDKTTHFTTPQGTADPRVLAIKNPFLPNAQVIQMRLYQGDSIHTYRVGCTAMDSVAGTSTTDTATITYRYWNRYPPQNVDGSKATHLCTMADSLSFGCSIFYQDVIITGANADPIKDAAGVTHNTSFLALPQFSDSFHIAQNGRAARIYIHANGNPYWTNRIDCDTLGGGLWQPIGMKDTLQAHKIYITSYGPGRAWCQVGWHFANIRNVDFTGKYDPVMGIGDANYPGHSGANGYAYSDTLYKFGTDNNYMSIADHGIQVEGKDTYAFEIEYFSSIRGNFDGIEMKCESNSVINGNSRLLFWDFNKIHDCFVSGAHGENIYNNSANPPAVQARHSRIYNNRSTMSGNKLIKTEDLNDDNWVFNNVGAFGDINFPSAFETGVSPGSEATFSQGNNKVYNNIMYKYGNQGLNILTQMVGTPTGVDSITNNAYIGGVGPIGSLFLGQLDSAFHFVISGNYFGGHGPFLFGQVYNGGADGTNTTHQSLALPGGSLSGGATRSTYKYRNNVYDSTKVVLTFGDATFDTASNLLISLVPNPQFANTGFEGLPAPIQMVDSIYQMWGDETNPGSGVKKGQPFLYSIGQVVRWFDKFYTSRINNNTFFPTGVTDANWTLIRFSNGGTTPPSDFRLPLATDIFAQQGKGLLDQIVPPRTGTFLRKKRGFRFVFHPQ